MDRYNYYREQLESVSGHPPEYDRTFQIRCEGGSTKWINLNHESASELVRYLMAHYKVDVPTDR